MKPQSISEEQIERNQQLRLDDKSISIYKREMIDALKLSFPALYTSEIEEAVNYSIMKRFYNAPAVLDNNYEKKKQDTTLYAVLNYIIEREPIITVSGVMFKKHGSCPNPYVDLIQEFLRQRGEYKTEMFKYPKGSEQYEKYNILQSSEKVSANAIYGASGNNTSIFYNLYVAQSITMQGQNCISSAIMLFESLMANNVKFGSLNECVQYINNIRREPRYTNDYDIIDEDITVQECFYQIVSTFGFYYIPDDKDLMIIWDMLNKMSQQDINRIFYKNNLFWFFENKAVMNALIDVLQILDKPFLDPNSPPFIDSRIINPDETVTVKYNTGEVDIEGHPILDKCDFTNTSSHPVIIEKGNVYPDIPGEVIGVGIEDYISRVYNLIKEWVYYDKQYMDRLDRAENMYRSVSVLTDTDSCFISFDGWYRFVLGKTYNIPMKIKEIDTDANTGETESALKTSYDYNFYTDEIVELEEAIRPDTVGPGVGYRCSIINILAYTMGKLAIDYMSKYSNNSNSLVTVDGKIRKSYFILKNEFQLKRALVTDNKKNYCSYQERQEASIIPKEKALDIKGMPIRKVGIPETTKRAIENILMDQILDADEISLIDIVKQLAVLEKQIYNSVMAGEKEFFKPVRIKSSAAYDDPMRQFGIKASVVYNMIKDPDMDPIDLTERNSILIIEVLINDETVEQIKDTFPYQYQKIKELLASDILKKKTDDEDSVYDDNGNLVSNTTKSSRSQKVEIKKVAIPETEKTPEWIKPFINFTDIISANISSFPCEALGISVNKAHVNYTNIVKF